jgi:hypothetical protein
MQDADDFDAIIAEWAVKNHMLFEQGAAQAWGEVGTRMANAVVKGEMLDAFLNAPNPAARLKLAITGYLGPNLIEIGQALQGPADDWLHAARAAVARARFRSMRNCSTSKSLTNSP